MLHFSRWHSAARGGTTVLLRLPLYGLPAAAAPLRTLMQCRPGLPGPTALPARASSSPLARLRLGILPLLLLGALGVLLPFSVVAPAALAQGTGVPAEITPETAPPPPGSPAPASPSPSAPAAAPGKPGSPAPAAGGPALRILAQADHMPAWLRGQIQARTGTTVAVDAYKTDAEALQKATQTSPPYDLILVSDRVAAELARQRKLSPVKWPLNKDLVYGKYRGHYYDQENHLTLAYAMSLTGYAYKIADFPKPPAGWKEVLGGDMAGVLWRADPAWRRALLAHADIPADAADARMTTPPPAAPRIVVDTIPELCRRFGGDSRNWKIVLPGSGSVISLYQVAIPMGAPRPREALAAVQELFTPRTMAKLSMETLTSVTMPTAYKQLLPQYATHPLLYPSEAALDNSVFVKAK